MYMCVYMHVHAYVHFKWNVGEGDPCTYNLPTCIHAYTFAYVYLRFAFMLHAGIARLYVHVI
jgi:hypothetical protein